MFIVMKSLCMSIVFIFLIFYSYLSVFFFLMLRQPPRSTRTDTLFPYPTLFRSGPVLRTTLAGATDPETRFAGSSGGVISALGAYLLSAGAVDAVLHVGADDAAPIVTAARTSTTAREIVARAGSRYAPSPTLAGLCDALARFERLAVIGKPCDIAGLRRPVRAARSAERRVGQELVSTGRSRWAPYN